MKIQEIERVANTLSKNMRATVQSLAFGLGSDLDGRTIRALLNRKLVENCGDTVRLTHLGLNVAEKMKQGVV